MGYIRHDAIIATSWKDEHLAAARAKAEEIGLKCSEIMESPINGYKSFMIVPDGSKEGWIDSGTGEERRAEWKAWMRCHDKEEEPCMWVDWAHVNFGGDDPECSNLADHSGLEPSLDSENVERGHPTRDRG